MKVGQVQLAEKWIARVCRAAQLMALLLLGMGTPALLAATAATTTTLAVTANGLDVTTVDAGTVVTLTATVESGGKPVTPGQVNFCDTKDSLCSDIHLLGTAQLSSAGTAKLNFVPRPGGHGYKAEFVSTVNDSASSSVVADLTVYGTTTTTITSSGSAGNYTLKGTVTGTAVPAGPAGEVEFRDTSDGNAVLATATLGSGTSTSTWVNTQSPATPPQPLAIAVGDFNGDGIPDIVVGTNGATTGYLSIFLGNGDGTFQAAKTFTSLPNNQALVAAPFVTDGPLDVLTVDNNTTGTNNAALFIGDGKGGGTMGAPFSLGGLANVTGLAAGDFNRDGNEDFVITGIIYGVYCFAPVLGNGNGTFGGPTLNAVGNNPLLVAVGAFNTHGYSDIAVTDTGTDQVTLFQNNSQGYFFPEGQANTGTRPTAMATGDFNGDGYLDLAVTNGGNDSVTILLGKGNETLTPGPQSPATGSDPSSLAVGDFNADGIADLAVVNGGGKSVTILLGKGDGTFATGPTLVTGIHPDNVVTGDFSGTGVTDLVVTNQDIPDTTGSTLTVEAAELTHTANATATRVSPGGVGSHLVDAEYGGDSLYNTSTSATSSLTGLSPAATPKFSLAAGTYTSTQTVTLTDATSGAVLYYTTNGATPTPESTKYTGAITVSASETVEAIAVATGYGDSAVATATYSIQAALPVFNPVAGSYASAQTVTITDATSGAVIYYTTNGTTPTTASTKYTGAISVSATETLKAIAVATGDTNSAVASAAYTIGYPIATVVATPSGTDTLTIPVGGSGAFVVATENESSQSFSSVTVKTTTGPNPSLPVQVTVCETNPSSGQCMAAPGATVTVAPFAAGATPTFSVFVTATAAIASSPNNEVVVVFTDGGGTIVGSASALIVTN
jgi:hypothetical protein